MFIRTKMLTNDFYRATEKHMHGIAIVILSVRLSDCLSNACVVTKRDNCMQIYEHHTIEQCSSFLGLNFVVLSLGVHPERVCQRGVTLCRKRKFDQ